VREWLDREIVAHGLAFQISTRLTSWVAIDREVTIDPKTPTRHETMPQALPHGMSAIGLGLRPEAPSAAATGAFAMAAMPMQAEAEAPKPSGGILRSVVRAIERLAAPLAPPPPAAARPSAPMPGRAAPPQPKRKQEKEDDGPVLIARSVRRPELEQQRNAPEPSAADGFAPLEEESADLQLGAAIVHAPRSIAGRMIKGSDDRLVFEIDVPAEGRQWQLGDTIELVLADGTRVAVPIDRDHCTRDGHYTGGVRLRVACTAPAQSQAIVAVHVLGEAPLVITL
jgi:Ca-activated chloride channel family protein